MHYGVEYPYGARIINKGNRPNVLVRFRWQQDLDQWLATKPAQGERERIDSRHPYVRLSQRKPEGWVDGEYRIND